MRNKEKKKGGRPPKGATEKLKYRITLKMATADYFALLTQAKNAGVSANEYLRGCFRNGYVKERLTAKHSDYVRKLCGMANNLNQLARGAHREGVRLHSGQCRHLLLSLETLIDRISL